VSKYRQQRAPVALCSNVSGRGLAAENVEAIRRKARYVVVGGILFAIVVTEVNQAPAVPTKRFCII